MKNLKHIKRFNESLESKKRCKLYLIANNNRKDGLSVSSPWHPTVNDNSYLHITDKSAVIKNGDFFVTHDKYNSPILVKCNKVIGNIISAVRSEPLQQTNGDVREQSGEYDINNCEKVIMSHDKTLNLPLIGMDFIKKYISYFNNKRDDGNNNVDVYVDGDIIEIAI
jgi:hypothetical protein